MAFRPADLGLTQSKSSLSKWHVAAYAHPCCQTQMGLMFNATSIFFKSLLQILFPFLSCMMPSPSELLIYLQNLGWGLSTFMVIPHHYFFPTLLLYHFIHIFPFSYLSHPVNAGNGSIIVFYSIQIYINSVHFK